VQRDPVSARQAFRSGPARRGKEGTAAGVKAVGRTPGIGMSQQAKRFEARYSDLTGLKNSFIISFLCFWNNAAVNAGLGQAVDT